MFPDQQSAKTMESMREFAKSHLLIKPPVPPVAQLAKKPALADCQSRFFCKWKPAPRGAACL